MTVVGFWKIHCVRLSVLEENIIVFCFAMID